MMNDGLWHRIIGSVVVVGAIMCTAERLVRGFQPPANKLAGAATQFADTYAAVAQRPCQFQLGAGVGCAYMRGCWVLACTACAAVL